MNDRGFVVTVHSFLLFAATLVVAFTVFTMCFQGTIAQIENLKLENMAAAKQQVVTGRVYIMNYDNVYHSLKVPPIKTKFVLNGVEFYFWGEHYKQGGVHGENEADFFVNFLSERGASVTAVWHNQKWFYAKGDPAEVSMVSLNVPHTWMRRDNVRPSWPPQEDLIFDVTVDQAKGKIIDPAIYAAGKAAASVDYRPTWTETFVGTLKTIYTFVPRVIFGAIFGETGTQFVDTLGNVLTMNFPGVPAVIRALIAIPMLFVVTYIAVMTIRSFIPFLGGGGG